MSAARPTSPRAACASSASRSSASPRIICASCASSASTPASARATPDAAALDACAARANDLMALSRERIADELLKLLGLPDPSPTLALMASRGILAPVLPELRPDAAAAVAALAAAETAAGLAPAPAAPPRRHPAARPRARAQGRRAAQAQQEGAPAPRRAPPPPTSTATPRALAYRHGTAVAQDRLLLAGRPADAAA